MVIRQNQQSLSEAEQLLACAETVKGSPLPTAIQKIIIATKKEFPDYTVSFSRGTTMDFFKKRESQLCFLSKSGKYFFFHENPKERSQIFFAYEIRKYDKEIILYSKE